MHFYQLWRKIKLFVRLALIVWVSVSLVACTTMTPVHLNNQDGTQSIFLTGDDACTKYRAYNADQILCYDKDGEYTNVRQCLTEEEFLDWKSQETTREVVSIALGCLAVVGFVFLIVLAARASGGNGGYNKDNGNLNDEDKEDLRGCCSFHGGIAGYASDGRVICKDRQYSPTCWRPL